MNQVLTLNMNKVNVTNWVRKTENWMQSCYSC